MDHFEKFRLELNSVNVIKPLLSTSQAAAALSINLCKFKISCQNILDMPGIESGPTVCKARMSATVLCRYTYFKLS